MKYFSILPAVLFIVCSVLNLAGQFKGTRKLSRGTKPYLMPFLLIFTLAWLLVLGAPSWTVLLYVVALMFHTAGDILLLFPTQKFFLGGLAAFLFGHFFYIALFAPALCKMNWIFLSVAAVLILVFVIYLIVNLKSQGAFMLSAVIVYAITLSTVVFSCLANAISSFSAFTVLLPIGAFLFITSDCMLAYARFKHRFKNHNFYVMLTYILGQALISAGLIGMNLR